MEYVAREDSAQRQIVIWVLGIFISILGEWERERNTKESRSSKKTECRCIPSVVTLTSLAVSVHSNQLPTELLNNETLKWH